MKMFVNRLWQHRASYAKVEIRRLTELEAGTDATYVPEDEDDSIVIGPVAQLVCAAPNYAVFVDDRMNVRYVLTKAGEAKLSPDFSRQWNRISKLQFVVDQLRETMLDAQLETLRELIGQAVAAGLDGPEGAMGAAVDELEPLMTAKTKRNAKRTYVVTAIRTTAISVIVALAGLAGNYSAHVYARAPEPALYWISIVLFGVLGGAVGALFSILTATSKEVPFDPLSSADYARFESRTRVLIGTLSGIIMSICYSTGMIGSTLTNVEPASAGALLLAAVAGFAERLVPNILMKTAGQLDEDSLGAPARRPSAATRKAEVETPSDADADADADADRATAATADDGAEADEPAAASGETPETPKISAVTKPPAS